MTVKCPRCKTDNPDSLKFCGECGTRLLSLKNIEVTETIETPREELKTGAMFAGRCQIVEELSRGGNDSQAWDNCEKFLDLWRDADSGIDEVQDARKRLTALK